MHNLAIALYNQGHKVTGSDDEIYDPARSKLAEFGLLPATEGWDADRITSELDAVIVGMHAKAGNPELEKAKELGLKTYSFPEYIAEHSKSKQRIVIAGSHGKSTITSMVMHVLRAEGRLFDYLVGGKVEGFDHQVSLSDNAPMIIIEGDEYLTSPLDPRPKFLLYNAHIALVSGIAWDHFNVFPTEKEYHNAFVKLIQGMPKAGMIVYNTEDKVISQIVNEHGDEEAFYLYPYKTPDYKIRDGKFEIKFKGQRVPMNVFGRHNMTNIAGAYEVCQLLAIDSDTFLQHISTFTGTGKRLEKIHDDGREVVYQDFAHAPSKVKATVEAVAELHKKQHIVACLELHTFSSLNKEFIGQYAKTLKAVKNKIVFVNQHTLEMKGYPAISREEIVAAFKDKDIIYATTEAELQNAVKAAKSAKGNVFLMMSSGNFAGLDLKTLALDS